MGYTRRHLSVINDRPAKIARCFLDRRRALLMIGANPCAGFHAPVVFARIISRGESALCGDSSLREKLFSHVGIKRRTRGKFRRAFVVRNFARALIVYAASSDFGYFGR